MEMVMSPLVDFAQRAGGSFVAAAQSAWPVRVSTVPCVAGRDAARQCAGLRRPVPAC